MRNRILLFVVVSALCFSCKKQEQIEGYTRDASGFYYKLLAIGDGNEKPEKENVVVLDAVMKTQLDSVFWDTRHDAMDGLYVFINSQLESGSCNRYFLNMVEGDSASFLIRPSVLFRNYFDTIIPDFCKNDSLVCLNVRLNQIISKPEYDALKQIALGNENEDTELQELRFIDDYLKENYKSVKADGNGIYVIKKTTTDLEKVTYGKKVKVVYQGFFLDGKPVDLQQQFIEYVYGTPDQVIKGLNIVIGSLKKGEIIKIIVPSRLAFGEFGSSNGSIAPYTSLVYNIKIIDIK